MNRVRQTSRLYETAHAVRFGKMRERNALMHAARAVVRWMARR